MNDATGGCGIFACEMGNVAKLFGGTNFSASAGEDGRITLIINPGIASYRTSYLILSPAL